MELTQEHVSKLETEFWGAENGGEQESQPTPSEPQQEKTEGDTPPKENDWYKNFGWESEELAKTEIDKLKSIKQPEFKNEESKQLYEAVLSNDRKAVISFLQEQEKLENIITGEVTKDNAADIIKLVIKDKYKELSDKEIDKKFDKIYPSKKAVFSFVRSSCETSLADSEFILGNANSVFIFSMFFLSIFASIKSSASISDTFSSQSFSLS